MTNSRLEDLLNLSKIVASAEERYNMAERVRYEFTRNKKPCKIVIGDGSASALSCTIPPHMVDGILNQIYLMRVFELREAKRKFEEAQ